MGKRLAFTLSDPSDTLYIHAQCDKRQRDVGGWVSNRDYKAEAASVPTKRDRLSDLQGCRYIRVSMYVCAGSYAFYTPVPRTIRGVGV